MVACAAPIGLFFGRIANFINAELYGRETSVPWAVMFPQKDFTGAVVGYTEPRHPSQLYEAVLEGLVLFVIMRFLIVRMTILERPGAAAGVFLIGYGVFRGLVELVREPDAQMPEALRGYVTMGMLLCVPMILAGWWLLQRAKPAGRPAAA
jgi:phosphatidylglycerol:prolipoprotein diacylglycerol transferase